MRIRTTFTIAIAFCVLFLNGCATQGTLPSRVNIEKSRTYDASFDIVWSAIIQGIAETNMPITTLEKDSGLIAITDCSYSPADAHEGTRGSVLGVPDQVMHRKASLNIFATNPEPDRTKVLVNLGMKMHIRKGNGSYAFPFVYSWEDAYSNGNIERLILDGISRRTRALVMNPESRELSDNATVN